MYSSTLSLASAPDGGGWSTPRPGSFTTGNDQVPIIQETGWAPGTVWKLLKTSPPPTLDPRTFQPVGSRCTDWTIPAYYSLRNVHLFTCSSARWHPQFYIKFKIILYQMDDRQLPMDIESSKFSLVCNKCIISRCSPIYHRRHRHPVLHIMFFTPSTFFLHYSDWTLKCVDNEKHNFSRHTI
jgi:hypothetical protein